MLKETKQRLSGGENPRNLKMELAYELVRLVHGEGAAQGAKEDFVAKFQNKEIPDDLPEMELSSDINLIEALLKAGFIASKSEARRMISQGGVKVDGETVKDVEYIIRLSPEGVVLQKGKRQFVRVIGKK